MGSSEKIEKKLKKEKSEDKTAKKEKKEKKRSESDGIKKESKDKKKDKKKQENLARALDAHLQAEVAASSAAVESEDEKTMAADIDPEDIIQGGAKELVPFAFPLADEKAHKKVYKLIKKGAKVKAIHRGVKECEKAIKKSPLKKAGASASDAPGIVVIAGDISPMEVIMHFPVLCEEHGVPYLFVNSRTELGQSACTKRATSVVMLKPAGKKGSDTDEADAEEFLKLWKDMSKYATKEWTAQVEPWVKGIHPKQVAANVRR